MRANANSNDLCKCVILDKNSFDPTLSIFDRFHRQHKLSQILDNNNTFILNRFHMDYHKVKQITNKHTHTNILYFMASLSVCVFFFAL